MRQSAAISAGSGGRSPIAPSRASRASPVKHTHGSFEVDGWNDVHLDLTDLRPGIGEAVQVSDRRDLGGLDRLLLTVT